MTPLLGGAPAAIATKPFALRAQAFASTAAVPLTPAIRQHQHQQQPTRSGATSSVRGGATANGRGDLHDVSCSSPSACTAVGGGPLIWMDAAAGLGPSGRLLVERWNGTKCRCSPRPGRPVAHASWCAVHGSWTLASSASTARSSVVRYRSSWSAGRHPGRPGAVRDRWLIARSVRGSRAGERSPMRGSCIGSIQRSSRTASRSRD